MHTGDSIEMAKALAVYAHSGQVDKAGRPYIEHLIAVAEQVDTAEEKVVAYLHDIVEDTFVDNDTIRNLFGSRIADAVAAMTHAGNESYEAYVTRVARNSIARKVKLADLSHNMDISRLKQVTSKDRERLEKYRRAKVYLEQNE